MSSAPVFSRTREMVTLTRSAAQSLVEAAIVAATERAMAVSVAVHDTGGNLLAFSRMDGAPALTIEIAQNKSYTAVSFGLPTHQWHEIIKDDEPLKVGIVHTPPPGHLRRRLPRGGRGSNGGAIGVSGGHYSQDMAVAEAALAAFEPSS